MNRMPSPRAAHSLKVLLARLRGNLRLLFAQRSASYARSAGQVQRLLTGLELLCRIEKQVVLPALSQMRSGACAAEVRLAIDELDLMRDLAMMARHTSSANLEFTLTVLEGLALLHFERGTEMLDAAPADAADWPALEHEVRNLLGSWQLDARAHADVEDEEGDPVGLPPR